MIPTANGGVNYYRFAAWAFQMRKYRNVEVALFEFQYNLIPPHYWERTITTNPDVKFRIAALCKHADAVIWGPVHYDHTLQVFNEMRQTYGKLTLVEIDDNMLDVPPWNEAFHSYGPNSYHRRIAMESLKMADGLIVSTPHLKEIYAPYNENITVVENSLDFKGDSGYVGWGTVRPKKHRGVRVGWIGGRGHFDDLMTVAPALREMALKHPEVRLCLINSALKLSCEALGKPYPFAGLDNVFIADRSVPVNRYPRFAAHFGFDVGLAPLIECNFNKSKSNLRWLEMGALGVPTVATDIHHFSRTVRSGVDGLLISGNDLQKWQDALELLITDTPFRENMGRTANKRIRDDFNVKKNAPAYFRLLKKLHGTTIVGDELVGVN